MFVREREHIRAFPQPELKTSMHAGVRGHLEAISGQDMSPPHARFFNARLCM
jgi:hypothetical protein